MPGFYYCLNLKKTVTLPTPAAAAGDVVDCLAVLGWACGRIGQIVCSASESMGNKIGSIVSQQAHRDNGTKFNFPSYFVWARLHYHQPERWAVPCLHPSPKITFIRVTHTPTKDWYHYRVLTSLKIVQSKT